MAEAVKAQATEYVAYSARATGGAASHDIGGGGGGVYGEDFRRFG
eukprot:CAMPEP_0194301884 /NCGR_PEP_ID=MMETSP0169-20130528/62033_1 /TAXON_ID=218684 /ORGANISM="Corethron pennatum, Strain L29A3" /LENGTH=44 /DNA_ID= /DNA_START= /DNA_END= /DNA_ORIENTATION=